MSPPSLSLLFASATLLLCLSPQLSYSLPTLGEYDQMLDKPDTDNFLPEKTFSWNTPFRFQYEAPPLSLNPRFPPAGPDVTEDWERQAFARLARSEAADRALLTMLLLPQLSSSLGLENLSEQQQRAYRRDARGIKRKMFWSPLGYVPHRDIKVTDKEKSAGNVDKTLFRYG